MHDESQTPSTPLHCSHTVRFRRVRISTRVAIARSAEALLSSAKAADLGCAEGAPLPGGTSVGVMVRAGGAGTRGRGGGGGGHRRGPVGAGGRHCGREQCWRAGGGARSSQSGCCSGPAGTYVDAVGAVGYVLPRCTIV